MAEGELSAGETGAEAFGDPVEVIVMDLTCVGRIALALVVGLSSSTFIILSLSDRCGLVGVVAVALCSPSLMR